MTESFYNAWLVAVPHKEIFFPLEEKKEAFAKFDEWEKELADKGYRHEGYSYPCASNDDDYYQGWFRSPDGEESILSTIGTTRNDKNPFHVVIIR